MPASERLPVSIARMAQPKSLGRLKDLAEACAQCAPPVSSRSLALALRAALATDARWQRWRELELVWTGPVPMDSALRRTDQAILDVISGSRRELLMVTFAAYKIPEVARALVEAANRGVFISLVVESAKVGTMTLEAISVLGLQLSRMAAIYVWPEEIRQKDPEVAPGLCTSSARLRTKTWPSYPAPILRSMR